MLNNNTITYYHKTLNDTTRLEEYTKTIFEGVWTFASNGIVNNKGYTDSNYINVRIPLEKIEDTSIFSIGDIIAIGIQDDITMQKDLTGIEHYNVTSITKNNFGNNPHIHLGGK